ncbi:MAG: hypothetical protein L0Y64_27020, partial [Myxococcaceae bacterium]|nr:hypothetical protein [Myxococcaceae bacterium]
VAATVYQFTDIRIVDAVGKGEDLSQVLFTPAPGFIAGEAKLGLLGRFRVAYSVLNRQRFNVGLRTRPQLATAFPPPVLPAGTFVAADVLLQEHLSEEWGGLTLAYPLTEAVGIGLTQYATLRRQSFALRSVLQAVSPAGLGGLALFQSEYDYFQVGLVTKLGVGVDQESWSAGMTVTLPNVVLYGRGGLAGDVSAVEQDLNGDGVPISRISTDTQRGLRARYRWPLSVGVGGAVRFRSTALHLAAEGFGPVAPYPVMTPRPSQAQFPPGPGATESVFAGLVPVVNFGVGLEHQMTRTVRGYTSLRTDFSAAPHALNAAIFLTEWDLFHATAGADVRVGRTLLVAGVSAGFGRTTATRSLDLVPGVSNAELGTFPKLSTFTLTFLFGVTIGGDEESEAKVDAEAPDVPGP